MDEQLLDEQMIQQQKRKETRMVALGILIICMVAFTCGFAIPPTNSDKYPWNWVSSIIGWFYFACWSISFYPQAIINFRRKSVVGLSFDYQVLNIIGFSAYSTFNCAFYYDSGIQAEYQQLHDGKSNQVQPSDVFFSLHAVLLTIVILTQIAIYERGKQKVSRLTVGLIISILVLTLIYLIICLNPPSSSNMWSWLYFMYYLSFVKIGITLIKYTPQALLNYWRKSTVGCNIHNFLLDFGGGSLSIVQLCMDAWLTGDWSAVTGDLPKFILGSMSMVYDTIFFIQHYYLYTSRFDPALIKPGNADSSDEQPKGPSSNEDPVKNGESQKTEGGLSDDETDDLVEEATQYSTGVRTHGHIRARGNSNNNGVKEYFDHDENGNDAVGANGRGGGGSNGNTYQRFSNQQNDDVITPINGKHHS